MQIDVAEFSKPCACGHVHEIVVDDMIIEKGAIKRLPQIMKDRYSQYKKIAMLCDDNTYLAAGKTVEELLPGIITIRLDSKNLHADEHGVEAAEKQLKEYKNIDFMIAVGSGTIHDITRYHAYEKKIPFLSVPTAASVDGFVSTVAAMTWHGFKKSFTAVAPCFVLADSEIFSKAPLRLTASGVGDLLGKYTALCDWKIAHIITGEYICDKVVDMEYGVLKDLCANLDGIGSQNIEAYENLMYGLLLSGIAMQMIGNSRPASGAEHHMSHLWEMAAISEPIDYYHGEKVGVGLCLATEVYKKAEAYIRKGTYHVKDHMDVQVDFIKQNITKPALQEEILKENTPNLMENITGTQIKEKEAEILEILAQLPSAEDIKTMMKKVNGLTTMKELELDESIKGLTLKLSPYVRQRLTFMRLLKFYDFYDEITKG